MKILVTLLLSLNAFAIYEDAAPHSNFYDSNHAIYQHEQNFRCKGEGRDDPYCSKRRDRALKDGCIDERIHSILVEKGLYPSCDVYEGFEGTCKCGCFAKDTKILAGHLNQLKYINIKELMAQKDNLPVATMEIERSSKKITKSINSIKGFSVGPEYKDFVVIKGNGKELVVTEEHPILLATGELVRSRKLKTGDVLLDDEGRPVKVNISRKPSHQLVYNLETNGESKMSHIIFADGFAVGDLQFQNSIELEEFEISIR